MTADADNIDRFALVGTVVEGRFRIERAVAEGGFGVVYLGTQLALERPVALKVLKTPDQFSEEAKAQFMASFTAEARTIARINHPSIVQVYDFGITTCPNGARAPWMALEWLTGGTLEAELLARRGRGGRSPSEVLGLLKPVLEAFAFAHREGIAHRDIKPANIMVVQGPTGISLRILDFGIAKIMESDELSGGSATGRTRTRSSQIAFSPGYAAAEQISQGRTGPWTDVHALALVISEMLTDTEPFTGDDMTVLFAQIMSPTRPTPKSKGFAAGPWEHVLQKALAVVPAERYRDAGELLRELEATVRASSSPDIKVPTLASAGGPIQPHKTTHAAVSQDTPHIPVAKAPVVPIAAAALLVAAGAGGFFVWQSSHATASQSGSANVVASAPPQAVPSATADSKITELAPAKIVDIDASAPSGVTGSTGGARIPAKTPAAKPPPQAIVPGKPEHKVEPTPATSSRPKSAKDIVE